MMHRRAILSALLGGLGLALAGKAATSQTRTGQASSLGMPPPQAELPADKAQALDQTEAAFSQRPQLHYNRQPQHRRPERRSWRAPRRSHRSRRARRPAGAPAT